MKDLNKDATAALELASDKVGNGRYVGFQAETQAVELHVNLALAHAQMAIARQAEITNLLQARKDFADLPLALSDVNDRLFSLLGL